ncbi:MAG: class I tRNA ligase family protein, partial [Candidatus Marinimicrobia bacterium]|nr:class I tRNA ligase family protein [Candidatus Neomarinimicrobiota bacterium]
MADKKIFDPVNNQVDFISLEHEMLDKWEAEKTFEKLVEKNRGNKTWSFLDGPITANNPMGVHHAWGRSLKDIYQRYHASKGFDLRYQNGFDCQGLWVEVEVEKELGFKSKREVEEHGIEKFVNLCKERVEKYSKIQTEQSKRLGYWMDWDNSYYTMSDENNYTIWSFLKKLFNDKKIYRGTDIVPWSGRSGTSYSQMEIIEGRKLVAHRSVFVKFPLLERENENLLVWTTTPWTLSSNVAAAVNVNLDYVKLRASDGELYYFAEENLEFKRLDKQFKDKKQWIDGIPKLKTIAQIFKERGGYTNEGTVKGSELVGLKYTGPFDEFHAQTEMGGFPFKKDELEIQNVNAINCHRVIDGGKDGIGNDNVVAGEGTGIVHIAPGCGAIDNKIGQKESLVEIAPLNDSAEFIDGFGWLTGKSATDHDTITEILDYLKKNGSLVYVEKYPHVYPHCWRSGDELVYRCVDEWYINMDWRERIKKTVDEINWIPEWGNERELEWLENMGDWMISKKRFWGLALAIWTFEDGSHFVIGSKEELKELAVEGWDEFEGHSPHRPWIDKVKIKHPETGLIGTRIPDVGNPWLDAGIVPYSTLQYTEDKEYWEKWFPADFVVECFPGQFRNWFYSLLAMSTVMEDKAPFKTLLGHALVKDETGREMHKSWGNSIWFGDAAEKMGVDVMRWLYAGQNPEHNLLFGYNLADEVRKNLITLWNTYSFFITYASL